MKPAEIYWTPDDGDNSDLIPGHVTRVIRSGRELRIGFAGQEGRYGDQYQGVLRIQLRAGPQTVEGTQSYKAFEGQWEPVSFSVAGKFDDARFTMFSGVWTEGGKNFRVEILGLPGDLKAASTRTTGAKSAGSGKQRTSR